MQQSLSRSGWKKARKVLTDNKDVYIILASTTAAAFAAGLAVMAFKSHFDLQRAEQRRLKDVNQAEQRRVIAEERALRAAAVRRGIACAPRDDCSGAFQGGVNVYSPGGSLHGSRRIAGKLGARCISGIGTIVECHSVVNA